MRQIKKKIIGLFALILIFSVVAFTSYKVKAFNIIFTTEDISIVGVSVKANMQYSDTSTGVGNGIRFEADFSNYTEADVLEFGVIIGKGNISGDDLSSNTSDILTFRASSTENSKDEPFYAVITEIPVGMRYQELTARAFVKNELNVVLYSEDVYVVSLVEACRKAYNHLSDDSEYLQDHTYDETTQTNLIKRLALANKVKKTLESGAISYYKSISTSDIMTNSTTSTYELIRGTYSENLIIRGNATIYGANKDIDINDDGTRKGTSVVGETIFTGIISNFDENSSNIEINGCKFENINGFAFVGGGSYTTLKNNIFETTGEYGISKDEKSPTNSDNTKVDNIIIDGNYFHSKNTTSSKAIYFSVLCKDITITNNFFTNDTTVSSGTINENDYGIKIDNPAANAMINISNNTFSLLHANQIISFGKGLSTQVKYYLSVINNNMSKDNVMLGGNGIEALYLANDSSVEIISNTNFNVCCYYNTLYLTSKALINDSTASYLPYVTIMLNNFYSGGIDLTVGSRPTATKINTRIGLGFSDDLLIFQGNYFENYVSKYAYKDNTCKSANNSDCAIDIANCEYTEFGYDGGLASNLDYHRGFYNDINLYSNELFASVMEQYRCTYANYKDYAYYGGTGDEDITKYIPSYDAKYANDLIIDNYVLYYNGSDGLIKDICSYLYINFETIEDKYDALLTTAYAYLNQGNQIDYDQSMKRRHFGIAPEEATEYRNIILDCSSFVNSVYLNTFGTSILLSSGNSTKTLDEFAEENEDTSSMIIEYFDASDYYIDANKATNSKGQTYYTNTEIEGILNRIKGELKVGDLINYRELSGGGHVIMYIGNNYFIHCTGNSFHYDSSDIEQSYENLSSQEETKGAVVKLNGNYVFSATTSNGSKRYLFNGDISTISVIRPLADTTRDFKITKDASNRRALDDVTIQLSVSTDINTPNTDGSMGQTILPSDNLLYTITVTNNGSNLIEELYIDPLDFSNLTYIYNTYTKNISIKSTSNNGNVYYISSLLAGETAQINIQVSIDNDLDIGTIIEKVAYVNGLSTNKVYNVIGQFSDSFETTLLSNIESFEGTSNFVQAAYNNISGFDLSDNNISYIMSTYVSFVNTNLSSYVSLDNNSILKNYISENLYGGYVLKNQTKNICDYDRIRMVKTEYLECGDIIVTRDNNEQVKIYLYINSTTIYTLVNGEVTLKVSNRTGYQTAQQFVEQLEAYDYYFVLRPNTIKTSNSN